MKVRTEPSSIQLRRNSSQFSNNTSANDCFRLSIVIFGGNSLPGIVIKHPPTTGAALCLYRPLPSPPPTSMFSLDSVADSNRLRNQQRNERSVHIRSTRPMKHYANLAKNSLDYKERDLAHTTTICLPRTLHYNLRRRLRTYRGHHQALPKRAPNFGS